MTVWNGRNYDDLDAVERAKVDEARVWVGERMLEWQAGELQAEPHRAGEIVEYLIEDGILADHMAALRWMASLDLPPAA
jgi:hypothetical protein